MIGKAQFSLRGLLAAIAFFAVGCALVRYVATPDDETGRVLATLAMPMLVCFAVAVLRGRLTAGLLVCVGIIFALTAFMVCLMHVAGIDPIYPSR